MMYQTHGSRRAFTAGIVASALAVAAGRLGASAHPAPPMMPMGDIDLMVIDLLVFQLQAETTLSEIAGNQGEHPELIGLAESLITRTEADLAQLLAWRDEWYPGLPTLTPDQMRDGMGHMMGAMPGMQIMGGTMGMMELAAYTAVLDSADSFDLAWLNLMIPHYLCSLMLAEMTIQQASRPELSAFVQDLTRTLMDEIGRMQVWRSQWYFSTATPAGS